MAGPQPFNYKTESNRYRYYYRRLQVFYQKPITQVSAAVLFTLATIIFFAVFAIRPTLITISELLTKIEDQKQVLTKAESKASALAAAQQLYLQISPSLDVLNQAIPPDYQIQQLLLSLESSAASLDIPITNLRVSEIVYPSDVKKVNSLQELKFTINFETSYPEAKSLITNFNQLPRLVTLDSISITQPEATRKNRVVAQNQVEVSLNCRTFYYPEKNNSL